MKKCEDIEGKLTAYIDERLSREERGLVEEHLRGCPDCTRVFDELKRTKALLEGLDEVEPPAWLTAKIMSRINEESEAKEGFFRKLFFPLHIKIPAEALAAAFVIVLSVLVYRTTIPDMTSIRQAPSGIQISKQAPISNGGAKQTPPASGTPHVKTAARDRGEKPREKTAAIEKPKEMERAEPSPQKALTVRSDTGPGLSSSETASVPSRPPAAYSQGNTVSEDRMKDGPPASRGETRSYPAAKMKAGGNLAADTMLKEEKAGGAPESVTRAAAAGRPHHRISIISAAPSETARKTKEILRSLESKEVKEKKQGETTVIYGWIYPRDVGPLTDRLKKIGTIQEKNTFEDTAAGQIMVEIAIAGTDRDPDKTGTRDQH